MWSLYHEDKFLEPLLFSSGKSQSDVVEEVLKAIEGGHRIIFIHGVCGTGKCLHKESLIFCRPSDKEHFGYYTLAELENKDGQIISLSPRGKIVESKFKNVRKTGRKKLFRLKTRTGREVIASANHPFLTINEKGLEWVALENLNEKSYICLPNKININKKEEMNEDVFLCKHTIIIILS